MKIIIPLFALVLTVPVLLATDCNQPKKCPPDTMCTEVFVMVSVKVLDGNDQPVKLDEVYTVRESNNEKLLFEQNMDQYYVVLDDSYQKKLQQQSDKFRFVGMKNGQKLVDEIFVISADCCHVKKESGKEQVILPK